jgi:enterochelin esterase family protein
MSPPRYHVVVESLDSPALAGNPLGDPSRRDLHLLLPEGHDARRSTPLVLMLAGFSGTGRMALNEDPWAEGLKQRVERLAGEGRLGPMIYALPDCFTRYGGSQYLDSSATGRYQTYVVRELVAAVQQRFAISRIGVVGKSSGGYGALVLAMRHPEVFSAVAAHAADMAFEYAYVPDFPKLVRAAWRHGGLSGFLEHFAASQKKRGKLMDAMNVVAMAACYSPDERSPLGFDLPFDLYSGAILPDVWARWLEKDPVRMLDEPRHVEALRRMRLVFVDAGTQDEYSLDLGARMFSARLRQQGVEHRHEEFDDGHMGVSYRYDVSLPLLWNALSG